MKTDRDADGAFKILYFLDTSKMTDARNRISAGPGRGYLSII